MPVPSSPGRAAKSCAGSSGGRGAAWPDGKKTSGWPASSKGGGVADRCCPRGYLYRRLLISRGEMPQGASGGRSILGLKLEALHAAGFARETTRLASLLPNGDLTVETAAPAARAALARREVDDACSYLTHLPAEGGPGDTYAQFALELGTLCQARAGLETAALLSVDLVREFAPGDTAFVALATRAAGGPALDVPNDEVFTGSARSSGPISARAAAISAMRRRVSQSSDASDASGASSAGSARSAMSSGSGTDASSDKAR